MWAEIYLYLTSYKNCVRRVVTFFLTSILYMRNTDFYREMRLQKVLSHKDVMITMGNIGNHAITSPIASLSHYLPPGRERWNKERLTRKKRKKLKKSNTFFSP